MSKYRSLEEVTEEYFNLHPEEIDDFLTESFEEYTKDGNITAFLSELRVIARIKGISAIADEIGMSRQGLQKALSSDGNPRSNNLNSILSAMGYRLKLERIESRV